MILRIPRAMSSPAAAAADTPTPSVLPGLALATFGAIAFSGKAIIVKLAYRHGVDAVTLIMFRMLFALPLFVALAWWAGRGKPALTRRDALVILGLGFSGYYLASFLDFAGLAYVTASFERLVLYLNPTLVLGLGWLLFGRRASGLPVEAREAAEWLRHERVKSVRLVTSDWHMRRARMELDRLAPPGVLIIGDAVPTRPSFSALLREYNKLLARSIIGALGAR